MHGQTSRATISSATRRDSAGTRSGRTQHKSPFPWKRIPRLCSQVSGLAGFSLWTRTHLWTRTPVVPLSGMLVFNDFAPCHFFNLWGNVVGMKCQCCARSSLAGTVIVATNIPGFLSYTVLMYELLFTTEAHFCVPSICDGAQW